MPVYAFVRNYRMQKAGALLKNTNKNIAEIALQVGYNNPSKFSSVFKDEFGVRQKRSWRDQGAYCKL